MAGAGAPIERSRAVNMKRAFPAALASLAAVIAGLGGWRAGAVAGEAAEPEPVKGPATAVTIADKPYPCRILRHDEKSITVFLTEMKSSVTLQWDQLPAPERERLKALVAAGGPAAAERPKGELMDGVEVTLTSGVTYRGIELAERSTAELRAFRFARMPFAALSVKDIKAVKPVKIYEGEIYTPQERYKAKLATVLPKTAEDHYQMGVWCLENELAQDASDHFDKCLLLDPGYDEKVKAKAPALAALKAKLLPAKPERPADPAALRREVINRWHLYLDFHVQRVASSRVSETPALPIKVVYLTNGGTLEGTLKPSEDDRQIVLDVGGRTFSIKRELIVRMEQKLVEAGPFRDRTLAESKKYVTDPKGGITADILAGVTKDLGIADKEALDIWSQRLSDKVVVGEQGPKAPEFAVAFHEARWGVGSWLRGGGAGGNPVAPANPRGGGARQPQWPDAETWWKEQTAAVKAQVLKAMCAEALMKVEKVYEENCTNCGGAGQLEVMGAGGAKASPCPVCRGSGRFYGVTYR